MINKTLLSRYHTLWPFLLVLLLGTVFMFYTKGNVVLLLNKTHSAFMDFFFQKLSSVGNALSVFFFLVIVLWRYELKFLYFFILAFLLESLVVVFLKQVLFPHEARPYLFFKTQGILNEVNFVEGLKINKMRSFPSGHTAYAFFIATFFALKFNKKAISLVLAIVAAFIGVSRIYLVQHFFVDVFTGAIIGIITTSVAYLLVFKTEKKWYSKRIFNKKQLV